MMKTTDFYRYRLHFTLSAFIVIAAIFLFFKMGDISQREKGGYTVKTFKTETGWGYSVLLNTREIIHQDVIPAISSQVSFATKADALKTADFVVEKLRAQKLPYLTKDDLKTLEISLQNHQN